MMVGITSAMVRPRDIRLHSERALNTGASPREVVKAMEVLGSKEVKNRGGEIVRYRQQVRNQRGEIVMDYNVSRLIRGARHEDKETKEK